jgi:hypothetical protein
LLPSVVVSVSEVLVSTEPLAETIATVRGGAGDAEVTLGVPTAAS